MKNTDSKSEKMLLEAKESIKSAKIGTKSLLSVKIFKLNNFGALRLSIAHKTIQGNVPLHIILTVHAKIGWLVEPILIIFLEKPAKSAIKDDNQHSRHEGVGRRRLLIIIIVLSPYFILSFHVISYHLPVFSFPYNRRPKLSNNRREKSDECFKCVDKLLIEDLRVGP